MRSPSEYYLKYLLTIPGQTLSSVLDEAQEKRLWVPSEMFLQTLSAELGPVPSIDLRDDKSVSWLKKHKIYDMWRKSITAKEALGILNDAGYRDIVEAFSLSPLPLTAFADSFPKGVTVQGAKTFCHYFFNISLLSYKELQEFIRLRGGVLHSLSLSSDIELSKNIIAAVTGRKPLNAPLGLISKRLIDALAVRIFQLGVDRPSKFDAEALSLYTAALRNGQEILSKSGAAAENLLDMMKQVDIVPEEGELLTYEELRGTDDYGEDDE